MTSELIGVIWYKSTMYWQPGQHPETSFIADAYRSHDLGPSSFYHSDKLCALSSNDSGTKIVCVSQISSNEPDSSFFLLSNLSTNLSSLIKSSWRLITTHFETASAYHLRKDSRATLDDSSTSFTIVSYVSNLSSTFFPSSNHGAWC